MRVRFIKMSFLTLGGRRFCFLPGDIIDAPDRHGRVVVDHPAALAVATDARATVELADRLTIPPDPGDPPLGVTVTWESPVFGKATGVLLAWLGDRAIVQHRVLERPALIDTAWIIEKEA